MKLVIYNEYTRNQLRAAGKKAYAEGLHKEIASIFDGSKDVEVKFLSTLKDLLEHTENDITAESLADVDVLIWWGHCDHDKVPDEVVDAVIKRVHEGMGIIFLHSAHFSKVIKKLLGTPCSLTWRECGEAERVWTADVDHPISQGVEQGFRLPHEEMYGEHFNIPKPDDVVFIGWYQGGDVFRSGVTFTRGEGRVFYFQPGHETFPTYKNANVRKVISNAVLWCGKQEDKIEKVNKKYKDAPNVRPAEQVHKLFHHVGKVHHGKEVDE